MPKKRITLPKGTKIPNHIAVVLDGNGRWARSRGLPPTKGHEAGGEAVRVLIDASRDVGVHTLTLWGFSTENWKRPSKEIARILSIVKNAIKDEIDNAHRYKVRFVHIGRKDRIPEDLLRWIVKAERETKNYNKHTLNLALDYGGRDEIIRAVKKVIRDGINPEQLDEGTFARYLDTASQPYPYPDLFIRTSGEQRTSGLMPWQMTYAEHYIEPDHLPDFTPDKLKSAILDYSRRRRRFGAKDKMKHFKFKPEVIARLELNWWRLGNIPPGTKFSEYAILHLKEQYGFSKELAAVAARYLIEGTLEGKAKKWGKSARAMKEFYKLIKEEIKLAFEPSIAASLQIKLWKDIEDKADIEKAVEARHTARELYAEIYRMSTFQAAKLAHLRVLASIEKNLAEHGHGDFHWDRAEDYLEKFYTALKERVA